MTFGFLGAEEVKDLYVTSGGEGMTMMMRISDGKNSYIETPFIIFKNKESNYPIRGVPDDVSGVSYGTGPNGGISNKVNSEVAAENRALTKLPNWRRRILFMENCSSHYTTDEMKAILGKKNTEFKYLPANATDMLQPSYSLVIQNIKEDRSSYRELHKFEIISK